MIDLTAFIRDIPDFPKPGIMFRDITPMLASPEAFGEVIRQFASHYRHAGITSILAAEARGFIFAGPLALELGTSFVPVRKPGKLPFKTQSLQYDLEYGTDTLEMHTDAVQSGDRVLLVDDLLATGGTMNACVQLARQSGAEVVGCAFVIELKSLKGRERLDADSFSLIQYEDE
ncbi:MAG: adenine phosphoribosyltransferase [Planctomycetaceae bacterium]